MSGLIRRGALNPRTITKREFISPFETLFNEFFNESFPLSNKEVGEDFLSKSSYPKVNILRFDDRIEIEAAVPGLTEDDISVEVSSGILSISGEKNQRDDVGDSNYLRREVKRSAFCRSFTLGENLDEESIYGDYANGILTVTIPKLTEDNSIPEVRKIAINCCN